jgi:hypothetical protein
MMEEQLNAACGKLAAWYLTYNLLETYYGQINYFILS